MKPRDLAAYGISRRSPRNPKSLPTEWIVKRDFWCFFVAAARSGSHRPNYINQVLWKCPKMKELVWHERLRSLHSTTNHRNMRENAEILRAQFDKNWCHYRCESGKYVDHSDEKCFIHAFPHSLSSPSPYEDERCVMAAHYHIFHHKTEQHNGLTQISGAERDDSSSWGWPAGSMHHSSQLFLPSFVTGSALEAFQRGWQSIHPRIRIITSKCML